MNSCDDCIFCKWNYGAYYCELHKDKEFDAEGCDDYAEVEEEEDDDYARERAESLAEDYAVERHYERLYND